MKYPMITYKIGSYTQFKTRWIEYSNKPPNPFEPVPEDRPEDYREGDEEDED